MKDESYSKIMCGSEFEAEEGEIKNKNKIKKLPRKKRTSIKSKIIDKCFLQRLTVFNCLLIIFFIFFIIIILLLIIFRLYSDSKNNTIKITQNIIDEKNITNNTEYTNIENITKNKNDNDRTKITDIPIPEVKENINISKEIIYKNYTFNSLKESFNKAKNFLDKSSKGIFLNDKSKFKSSENPLVSAIVPVYNSKNYINRALKSIQNQNITDIEIILINDYSTDNSLSIIEDLQKEDQRIKIIKNKKNMGILYSRSVGVLSSKGKYIFCLDNDGMFLDFDVFQQ